MIGMPTPKVWCVPMVVEALKVRRGVMARKKTAATVLRPRPFTAVTATW
jgi:hypothetical protein